MSLVLITTYLMYRDDFVSYHLMSVELGSATDIDRLLVFSGLSTPHRPLTYFQLIHIN